MQMAQQIKTVAYSLVEDSARGRRISQNRRELTVVYPYLIRYRIKGDTVTILEVRHGARRPAKSSGLQEEASIFDMEDEEAEERAGCSRGAHRTNCPRQSAVSDLVRRRFSFAPSRNLERRS